MNPQKLRHTVRAPLGDSDTEGGASDTTGTIAQAKEAITSTARDTAARIKSAADQTASRAKSEAQRLASETKEDTAKRLGGYSSAMHESAKSFEQQDPNIAWATHRVADRIQGVADYVRNRDFGELRNDAENFARRHPLAFFGGLFIGGLIVGNLLKAHELGTEDEDTAGADEGREWDTGNQSGTEPMMDTTAETGL